MSDEMAKQLGAVMHGLAVRTASLALSRAGVAPEASVPLLAGISEAPFLDAAERFRKFVPAHAAALAVRAEWKAVRADYRVHIAAVKATTAFFDAVAALCDACGAKGE